MLDASASDRRVSFNAQNERLPGGRTIVNAHATDCGHAETVRSRCQGAVGGFALRVECTDPQQVHLRLSCPVGGYSSEDELPALSIGMVGMQLTVRVPMRWA